MKAIVLAAACAAITVGTRAAAVEPGNYPAPVIAALSTPAKADGRALKTWLGTADAKVHPDVAVAALAVLWTRDAPAARKIYLGDKAFWTGVQRQIDDAKGLVPGASLVRTELVRIGDAVLPRFERAVQADRLDEALPAAPFVTLYSRYMCIQAADCLRAQKTFQVVNEAVERASKRKGSGVAAAGIGASPAKSAPSSPPSAFDLGGDCSGPGCDAFGAQPSRAGDGAKPAPEGKPCELPPDC